MERDGFVVLCCVVPTKTQHTNKINVSHVRVIGMSAEQLIHLHFVQARTVPPLGPGPLDLKPGWGRVRARAEKVPQALQAAQYVAGETHAVRQKKKNMKTRVRKETTCERRLCCQNQTKMTVQDQLF